MGLLRNIASILTQAAGHGGLSRIPGGAGAREPCVTCIRIELGETICPDGERGLVWPGLCGAHHYTAIPLHHITTPDSDFIVAILNSNLSFIKTVWRMNFSPPGNELEKKIFTFNRDLSSLSEKAELLNCCLGICDSCGQTPPSLQWMYPEGPPGSSRRPGGLRRRSRWLRAMRSSSTDRPVSIPDNVTGSNSTNRARR